MNIYIILTIFFLGFYFCLNYTHKDLIENFNNNYDKYDVKASVPENCPNLLVQKGKELHLVNTKKAIIPGVNPIKFKDLGEYIEYAKWQQKMKKDCPILFFQQTFGTQGKKGYRLLDNPLNPSGGVTSELLDTPNMYDKLVNASTDRKPYNQNLYSGFDPKDQQIGENTVLDENYITAGRWNPMQSDWNGLKQSELEAKEMKKKRGRSVADNNKPLYNTNELDRIEAQTVQLKSVNTRKNGKSDVNIALSESKKNNIIIKDSLKK